MRIITQDEITPYFNDKQSVLKTVKQGFIMHSRGEVNLPTPMQILFKRDDQSLYADCHIKAAASPDLPFFSIKTASGFYDNPAKGLPVNNGIVMLFSSKTGQPLALFQDKGLITSIRTAAAGALAVSLLGSETPKTLGIIGTGHQAELQAEWISATQAISEIIIWGRSKHKAHQLKDKLISCNLAVHITETTEELCKRSEIIVTTTPATHPILKAEHIQAGHHIIAMGADSPGKQELDTQIFSKANFIFTDDLDQCLEHGEFGHAVNEGIISKTQALSFGHALGQLNHPITSSSISIVDLTGLAIQDLALAMMLFERLSNEDD